MRFPFGGRKLDREEFDKCLSYLEQHYMLTTFQEKEADIYNEALTQHGPSLSSDSHSADEMLRVAGRLKKAAHELVTRSKQLSYVPESAGRLHFAWQIVFSDYAAWADAQHAVFAAIADGKPPFVERAQLLFRQHENSVKKVLQEEKNVLKLLQSNGLTPGDIQRLTDRAFAAVQAENWQTSGPGKGD